MFHNFNFSTRSPFEQSWHSNQNAKAQNLCLNGFDMFWLVDQSISHPKIQTEKCADQGAMAPPTKVDQMKWYQWYQMDSNGYKIHHHISMMRDHLWFYDPWMKLRNQCHSMLLCSHLYLLGNSHWVSFVRNFPFVAHQLASIKSGPRGTASKTLWEHLFNRIWNAIQMLSNAVHIHLSNLRSSFQHQHMRLSSTPLFCSSPQVAACGCAVMILILPRGISSYLDLYRIWLLSSIRPRLHALAVSLIHLRQDFGKTLKSIFVLFCFTECRTSGNNHRTLTQNTETP